MNTRDTQRATHA